MKRTLQKNWRRLAALFLCMFLLTGCHTANETMRTAQTAADSVGKDVEPLQVENELPEDGVVSQEQMATIAGKDGTYYFNGETQDGIAYQWAYDGKKVQNPIEQKLKVEFSSDGLDEIQKAAGNAPYGLGIVLQKMELAAPATLTLTLDEAWDADRVLYCTYEDGTIYQLSQAQIASVKDGKQEVSEISVDISKAGDTFYFLGGSTQGAKIKTVQNLPKTTTKRTKQKIPQPQNPQRPKKQIPVHRHTRPQRINRTGLPQRMTDRNMFRGTNPAASRIRISAGTASSPNRIITLRKIRRAGKKIWITILQMTDRPTPVRSPLSAAHCWAIRI